jgi:hypothetical protein
VLNGSVVGQKNSNFLSFAAEWRSAALSATKLHHKGTKKVQLFFFVSFVPLG